jgi:hypothetical protein
LFFSLRSGGDDNLSGIGSSGYNRPLQFNTGWRIYQREFNFAGESSIANHVNRSDCAAIPGNPQAAWYNPQLKVGLFFADFQPIGIVCTAFALNIR